MPSRSSPWTSTARVRAANDSRDCAARGLDGLEDRAVLVERREVLGELEEVAAQPVRLQRVADVRRRPSRRRAARRASARSAGSPTAIAAVGRGLARPPERKMDRIRACGVLQVRAGVAGQGEHPVQVEDVVRFVRSTGQVGVLHRADPDRPARSPRAPSSGRSGRVSSTTPRGPLPPPRRAGRSAAPSRRTGCAASCGPRPARCRTARARPDGVGAASRRAGRSPTPSPGAVPAARRPRRGSGRRPSRSTRYRMAARSVVA